MHVSNDLEATSDELEYFVDDMVHPENCPLDYAMLDNGKVSDDELG